MSYNNIAGIYRQESTHGSHPVELVGKLYEALIEDFRRAHNASDSGDIQARTSWLNHALQVLSELQSVLDHERGGEVARRLDGLYNVTRALITEANIQGKSHQFQKLIELYVPVRQAWKQVELDASLGKLNGSASVGESWRASSEAR